MKYIIAVIQPHRLDTAREALAAIGVQGLTVTEVRGFGRQKGQTEVYRGAEYTVQYVPKAKLEIAVDDGLADQVVETVVAGCHRRFPDLPFLLLAITHDAERLISLAIQLGGQRDAYCDTEALA